MNEHGRLARGSGWLLALGVPMATLALATGLYLKTSGQLSPGRLSELQYTGETLGGYSTHAQFEQKCQHCHAPVHCVSDTHCQDCHLDVAQQRAQAEGLHSRLPNVTRCQTCHVEHLGAEADITRFAFQNINHQALSGFSLAHHQANYDGTPFHCDSCHTQDRIVAETLDCLTCHTQADHDAMAGHVADYGTDCLACHDGVDRMTAFAHDQVYALAGAHAEADCAGCHADFVFGGTPRACSSCHAQPEVHAGQFGQDCARCHSPTAWAPATMTQHTFALAHGAADPVPCQTCHTDTYAAVTCYGCHDHTPAQTEATHLAEQWAGGDDLNACAACHPTGAAGEAATNAAGSAGSGAPTDTPATNRSGPPVSGTPSGSGDHAAPGQAGPDPGTGNGVDGGRRNGP